MLERRSDQQEIMDDLNINGPVVSQTLKELNIINKTLGGNQISVSSFKKMVNGQTHVVVADLGCGGGDLMIEMAKWSRKRRLSSQFVGIDANPNIIEYARENSRKYQEISYESINIFNSEFQNRSFDIIHCCLFLHHFSSSELVTLFKLFKSQAKIGVIVNDLHRHPLAYWSIKVLTCIFSKSEMVRNDAAVSVARGFKRHELIEVLEQAGIEEYKLNWKWAFRWRLMFYRKPPA